MKVNLQKETNILAGNVPYFNKYPFCNQFKVPLDNQVTVDGLLNELIYHKKQKSKEFFITN